MRLLDGATSDDGFVHVVAVRAQFGTAQVSDETRIAVSRSNSEQPVLAMELDVNTTLVFRDRSTQPPLSTDMSAGPYYEQSLSIVILYKCNSALCLGLRPLQYRSHCSASNDDVVH